MELKVITGNANIALSQAIVKELGVSLVKTQITRFSDGEIQVKIDENVSGKTAIILDDMVDTAGTLVKVASVLKEKGA